MNEEETVVIVWENAGKNGNNVYLLANTKIESAQTMFNSFH